MTTAKEISRYLEIGLVGEDVDVNGCATLSSIKNNSVVFATKYKENFVSILNEAKAVNILAIVNSKYQGKLDCAHIVSDNPRLDYIKVLNVFFKEDDELSGIHSTAIIEANSKIGSSPNIGSNVYIGKNVVIGNNACIYPNVVIMGSTVIGDNVIIKSGAVIGQSGFGFAYDDDNRPLKFPHLGGVIIGDNVYIGANTTIDRGTIDSTIIKNYAKIDNLVHIGHNDIIGENSFVIAGVSLGGGVELGKNTWIAPNASIREQTTIGDNALVGFGSVVIKNVKPHTVVFGNPAREIGTR